MAGEKKKKNMDYQENDETLQHPRREGAPWSGSSSTCIALVDVDNTASLVWEVASLVT